MSKQEEIMSDSGLGGIELGVEDLCGILEWHTHLTPHGRDKMNTCPIPCLRDIDSKI